MCNTFLMPQCPCFSFSGHNSVPVTCFDRIFSAHVMSVSAQLVRCCLTLVVQLLRCKLDLLYLSLLTHSVACVFGRLLWVLLSIGPSSVLTLWDLGLTSSSTVALLLESSSLAVPCLTCGTKASWWLILVAFCLVCRCFRFGLTSLCFFFCSVSVALFLKTGLVWLCQWNWSFPALSTDLYL